MGLEIPYRKHLASSNPVLKEFARACEVLDEALGSATPEKLDEEEMVPAKTLIDLKGAQGCFETPTDQCLKFWTKDFQNATSVFSYLKGPNKDALKKINEYVQSKGYEIFNGSRSEYPIRIEEGKLQIKLIKKEGGKPFDIKIPVTGDVFGEFKSTFDFIIAQP